MKIKVILLQLATAESNKHIISTLPPSKVTDPFVLRMTPPANSATVIAIALNEYGVLSAVDLHNYISFNLTRCSEFFCHQTRPNTSLNIPLHKFTGDTFQPDSLSHGSSRMPQRSLFLFLSRNRKIVSPI